MVAKYEGGGGPPEDHWIHDAVKRPGALHRKLGVKQGKKIPLKKIEKAAHSGNKLLREEAQFAENVKK